MKELKSNTPRLLDSSAKAVWFHNILEMIGQGTDPKVAIASVKHACDVGYILPSDMTLYISQLYPLIPKTKVVEGHIILTGDEPVYDSLFKLLGFAIEVEPARCKDKYDEFKAIIDNPPDNLSLYALRYQITCWLDDVISKYYNMEVGWRNNMFIVSYSFDSEEEENSDVNDEEEHDEYYEEDELLDKDGNLI
jgi:hypothetical protein